GAIRRSPSKIAFTKFCTRIACGLAAFSNGMSTCQISGLAKPIFDCWLNSIISASLRVKESLSRSRTSLPRVPAISNRFVPGASRIIRFGSIPVGQNPAHAGHLAQFTAGEQLLDFKVARFGPELKHSGKDDFGIALVGGNQSFRICLMRRNRLFNHGMNPLV